MLAQLASWLGANPPLVGINWASMLELAFRSLSWIWAVHFFVDDAGTDDSPWLVELLVALERQLVHIERNLSIYFSPNTHLLGEALALYVAGRSLPIFRTSDRHQTIGRRVLLQEISRQIAPDGGHVEQSTHYHRYTLDFYLLALAVARITADPAAEDFARVVERLAGAARLLADDRGRLPHIGDDDGGMLLPIADREPDDVRDSLTIASALLDRPELRIGPMPEEAYWMLGHPALCQRLERSRDAAEKPPTIGSAALSHSGYYVSRSAGHHLVLDAGRHGFGNGGHAHADALSLTLAIGGVPLLIDPGTGCYTTDPLLRDKLRSSALHNTLTLDGRSQSSPSGAFRWERTAASTAHRWVTNPDFDYIEASHDGYAPDTHRRHVLALHGDLVLVADLVTGGGTHDVRVHWHVDPRWQVQVSGRLATFRHPGGYVDMATPEGTLELFSGAGERGNGEPWLGWHAPVYGRVEPASAIRIGVTGPAPAWVFSVFGLDRRQRDLRSPCDAGVAAGGGRRRQDLAGRVHRPLRRRSAGPKAGGGLLVVRVSRRAEADLAHRRPRIRRPRAVLPCLRRRGTPRAGGWIVCPKHRPAAVSRPPAPGRPAFPRGSWKRPRVRGRRERLRNRDDAGADRTVMCGIAGFADSPAAAPMSHEASVALVGRMCDVIRHRGPDEGGIRVEPGLGIGMRRLSIIDLATGQQPLANEDRRVWTVFNGEIYNFRELRLELEAAGHRFSTASDTEVIVHAYEQWGPHAVARLRGMFGLAIWDAGQRTLLLARDRLGIKPLHYADVRRTALFRIRNQVAALRSRDFAGSRSRRARSLPLVPVHARGRIDLPPRPQAAARTPAHVAERRAVHRAVLAAGRPTNRSPALKRTRSAGCTRCSSTRCARTWSAMCRSARFFPAAWIRALSSP